MNAVRCTRVTLLALTLALAACGKKTAVEDDASPLAYVPADTAFVMANREPMPEATVNAWSRQMQGTWPILIGMYEKMLTSIPATDDDKPQAAAAKRVAEAIIAELKPLDSMDKWATLGFTPKARSAIYSVGLVPVMRTELGDPDAFRAMLARIEANSGAKLGTIEVGGQSVQTIELDKVRGLIAIEGRQLVASLLPTNADEALLRSVLGLDRPQQSLAASGALTALEQAEGYQPYFSGWVDLRRIVALIDKDPGYRAFAALATDKPAPALDDTCRAELDGLFAQMPRMVFGYTRIDAARMDASARLDLAAPIAQSLMTLSSPPPGSNAPVGALYDVALSLPVLKLKDFLLARIEPVVASPYQCAAFAEWNTKAVEMKAQLSQFVPPPLSDFTGLRLTLDHFSWPADGEPDLSARLLVATSNPQALVGMAQMALPALAQLSIPTDGTPVALPADTIPSSVGFVPTLSVAMNANAVALASGGGDLKTYLAAPAASDGQLMRFGFTGGFYALFGDLMGRFGAMLPAENQADLATQRELYALYAKWIKQSDLRINATPKGLEFVQSVEMVQ